MLLETQSLNQQAVNRFFEGYGNDTAKEYSQTFLEVISLLQQSGIATDDFLKDVTTKFISLNELVGKLKPGLSGKESFLLQ